MSVGLYILALFIVQNFFKKLYSESRVIRCIVFAPIFFFFFLKKFINIIFHLPKIKVMHLFISEISTIKESLNFIGREQFLA